MAGYLCGLCYHRCLNLTQHLKYCHYIPNKEEHILLIKTEAHRFAIIQEFIELRKSLPYPPMVSILGLFNDSGTQRKCFRKRRPAAAVEANSSHVQLKLLAHKLHDVEPQSPNELTLKDPKVLLCRSGAESMSAEKSHPETESHVSGTSVLLGTQKVSDSFSFQNKVAVKETLASQDITFQTEPSSESSEVNGIQHDA